MITFDVAITTYRRPDFAVAAVLSCLRQGPRLRKVIVIDDASGDNTSKRLMAMNDVRIECHVREINGGTGMARHDALQKCSADWVVMLDSDWELMPRALEILGDLAEQAPRDTTILGSRIQWDTGIATPTAIPLSPIGYQEQIQWRSRPDGLWVDNLSAVSRRAYSQVEWPALRIAWHAITLFYLDVAKLGPAAYSPHCLAYEKSDAPYGDSRGDRAALLARRKSDAPSGVEACHLLLDRHGDALRTHGPKLLASILRSSAMYALLAGKRREGWRWLRESGRIDGWTTRHVAIAGGLLCGTRVFERMFLISP